MEDVTKDFKTIVEDLYQEAENGIHFEIKDETVTRAVAIVKKLKVKKDYMNLGRCLCALNLMNTAIKMPEFKKTLSYGLIKPRAGYLIAAIDPFDDDAIRYFYNKEEACLYFDFYGVVFSFHNVRNSPELQKAALAHPIEWPGIRLQLIAQPLMEIFL